MARREREERWTSRSRSLMVPLLLVGSTLAAGGCETTCASALLTGTLQRDVDELVVVRPDGGSDPEERLRWPAGYRLEERDGHLVAVDIFGTVKAGEGDAVRLGGGEISDRTWGVCGLVEVATPSR